MSINRNHSLSRRRAVVRLGASGLGATLATLGLTAAAQEATPPASPADEFDPAVAQPDDEAGALLEPAVGVVEAQEAALEESPDASVRSVQLEREDNGLIWQVNLDDGTEVEIDAMTGEILETEQRGDEDEDDSGRDGDDDEDGN